MNGAAANTDKAPLRCGKQVGDDTSSIGEHRGTKSPCEKAQDYERFGVLRGDRSCVEDGQNAISGKKDDLPAI